MTSLVVSETFGPTIQGEGPHTGRTAVFIRLGGCNLTCSWCDTPYTWDAKRFNLKQEMSRVSIDDLTRNLPTAQLAVITGGEPLMQQDKDGWRPLLIDLKSRRYETHIETNGTIAPNSTTLQYATYFNVSPKPPSAVTDPKTNSSALALFRALAEQGRASFKFVAKDTDDLNYINAFTEEHRIPRHHTWIMPEGADRDTHLTNLQHLADHIVEHDYNLTTRLHVLIWNTERNR